MVDTTACCAYSRRTGGPDPRAHARRTLFNVCYGCGEYRVDKIIDRAGPWAVCPACGYRHAFRRLPLLLIGGASGTGKSAVCRRLTGALSEALVLESDILWRPEFDRPETDYRDYFELWLRLCKSLAQAGRPVALFGAGFAVPSNLEPCVERRYFSTLHYLALTCSDEELARRLRARPAWRASGEAAFIERHTAYNRWIIDNAAQTQPPLARLDTTGCPVEQTADQVAAWIRGHASAD